MPMILHQKRFLELTVNELYDLLHLRSKVFAVEQNIVYQDLDYDDLQAIHLWITEDKQIKALCRVCPAGTHMQEISIGRVISTERGKGYGKQIMLAAIQAARQLWNAHKIEIEAQEYARKFYEKVGFKCVSEPFMLEGIKHIKMIWQATE